MTSVDSYTSARLNTNGKQTFTYGYMVARGRMPYGQGIWPAFWMMGTNIGSVGWPTCDEIDIMENIGNSGDQPNNHSSLHDGNDTTQIFNSSRRPAFSQCLPYLQRSLAEQ